MQIAPGVWPISAIDFAAHDAFQEIQAEVLYLPSLHYYTRSKTFATKCESAGCRQSWKSQEKDSVT